MVKVFRARRGPIKLVGIGIEPEEPFVLMGGTLQLTARAKPRQANKGSITWSSSTPSNISVDDNGVIMGRIPERRVAIFATSDAGVEGWVYAYCGLDVTDISFEGDELTIAGIQGVAYSLSVAPSTATDISFTFESTDGTIANYYWNSAAAQRRMWGYSAGKAIVTAKGRSGNASGSCRVTVTPVDVDDVEIRAGYIGSTVTEQGDSIPPIIEKAMILVGQKWDFPVYFEPFNTTRRLLAGKFDVEGIASLELRNGAGTVYDRAHGTARYETEYVRGVRAGTTNLTISPSNGDSATIEINVVDSMSGSGTFTSTGTSTGRFNFSIPAAYDAYVPGVKFVAANNMVSNNWTANYTTPFVINLSRSDGSKAGYPSGYLAIQLEDGTLKRITSTVSGTI